MAAAAYEELTKTFSRIYRFQHAYSLCQWDEYVNMPQAAGPAGARAAAKAELKLIQQELLVSESTRKAIALLEEDASALNDDQKNNFREMCREFYKAAKLPAEHVEASQLAAGAAQKSWGMNRAKNDWEAFIPELKKIINLARDEGKMLAKGTDMSPYEALVDKWEPGMRRATMDRIFADLKEFLPGLVKEILEKQKEVPAADVPTGPFPIDKQKALGLEVMRELLKFDFDGGRLDISPHPFCGGVSEDVRLTTRYNEDTFAESLMGIVHETGHSRYEQNRPRDTITQPVAGHRSAGIHEGQSLFFEMQVGRSPAFMKNLSPLLVKHFGSEQEAKFSVENLQRMYSTVKPGKIRVTADEVTYPLHVLLRYEIEVALFEEGLEVEDIPKLWNAKMKEYLGIDLGDDFKDGCMQDVHWGVAYVGYFPTYTLGAIYAAQFMHAVRKDLGGDNVDQAIADGKMEPIFDWLKAKVWSKGSSVATGELLLEQATGEPLNVEHYKNHLRRRYLEKQ